MLLSLTHLAFALVLPALRLDAPCGRPPRGARAAMILGMGGRGVPDAAAVPKTVGEAKANFRDAYGAPVSPILNGFVQELLTSTQLAMASPSFTYTRIFGFGFSALCATFMNASPEAERDALQDSMCKALGLDPTRLRKDAQALREAATGSSEEALLASDDFGAVAKQAGAIPPAFRYCYPFGAGMLALMPLVDVEPSEAAIERWCADIGCAGKLTKDWKFFESAVDKMAEMRQLMLEMQAGEKRKEAARLKEEAEKAAKEATEAEAKEAA